MCELVRQRTLGDAEIQNYLLMIDQAIDRRIYQSVCFVLRHPGLFSMANVMLYGGPQGCQKMVHRFRPHKLQLDVGSELLENEFKSAQ